MQVLRANVDSLEGFMTTDVDKLADQYGYFVVDVLELTPRLNSLQLRKAAGKKHSQCRMRMRKRGPMRFFFS